MEHVRRGLALIGALSLLAHCHKTPVTAPEDAATAPLPAPTPPAPPSFANFEGEIDLLAKSADASKPPQPVSMLVRDDRFRVDVPGADAAKLLGGKAFVLVRVPDKKIDVVVDANKQVIELDLNNTERLKNLAKGASGGRPNSKGESHPTEPPPKIAKSGLKEKIAGYECEDWDVTSTKDGKKKASLCVAEIPVSFLHLPLDGVPPEYAFALELVDGQHMPLRVVAYDDKTGEESGRIEVTKIDRHPLEASQFEVPAGYTVIDAMQMIQAFAGGAHVPGMPSGMPGVPPVPGGLPGAPAHHKKHH
jgi:hypothetical protein